MFLLRERRLRLGPHVFFIKSQKYALKNLTRLLTSAEIVERNNLVTILKVVCDFIKMFKEDQIRT